MANEIQVTGQLQYTNSAQGISAKSLSIAGVTFSITGKNYAQESMSVPTTAGGTAIPLGSLGSLGWAAFKNNDATNYVDILTATSGTDIIRLLPGEFAIFRFGSGISAPAALAHTAVCLLEYLILEP